MRGRAASSLLATLVALPRPRASIVPPLRAARASPARACAADAASPPPDEPHRISLALHGPEDTIALGAKLASLARQGDVVLLHGDYGAGKTCLARGFVRCWYSDPTEQVTSPSYLIDNVRLQFTPGTAQLAASPHSHLGPLHFIRGVRRCTTTRTGERCCQA